MGKKSEQPPPGPSEELKKPFAKMGVPVPATRKKIGIGFTLEDRKPRERARHFTSGVRKALDVTFNNPVSLKVRKGATAGGKHLAYWGGFSFMTGFYLPGSPTQVLPVMAHVNMNLLKALLPEKVLARMVAEHEERIKAQEGQSGPEHEGAAGKTGEYGPGFRDTRVGKALGNIYHRVRNHPKVDASIERARKKSAEKKEHLTETGKRLYQNSHVKKFTDYYVEGVKQETRDYLNDWQRFRKWLMYPKGIGKISPILTKGALAAENYRKSHPEPGSVTMHGKYGSVEVYDVSPGYVKVWRNIKRVATGKPMEPYDPGFRFKPNLPAGTVSKKELEAEIERDVQSTYARARRKKERLEWEYKWGHVLSRRYWMEKLRLVSRDDAEAPRTSTLTGLTGAKATKWTTRVAAGLGLVGANLAFLEGVPIVWTDFVIPYETAGDVVKTYEIPGFGPTGVPQLHTSAYIVAPQDNRCVLEIVDAWTKMRWWCIVRGTKSLELHRLVQSPIFEDQIERISYKPISQGWPDGRVTPANNMAEVMDVHPENEFYDYTDENPYDFWAERFHDAAIRVLPHARIELKRPDQVRDPRLRAILASFHKVENGEVVVTPEGMAVVAAIAGITLDNSYLTPEQDLDQRDATQSLGR